MKYRRNEEFEKNTIDTIFFYVPKFYKKKTKSIFLPVDKAANFAPPYAAVSFVEADKRQ